jgi:hypothetical protein
LKVVFSFVTKGLYLDTLILLVDHHENSKWGGVNIHFKLNIIHGIVGKEEGPENGLPSLARWMDLQVAMLTWMVEVQAELNTLTLE